MIEPSNNQTKEWRCNQPDEMKTFKLYMGVKLNMVREGDGITPDIRTNPHFISSFQDFVRCDVYDELQRQEQDVDNTGVGRGFAIKK